LKKKKKNGNFRPDGLESDIPKGASPRHPQSRDSLSPHFERLLRDSAFDLLKTKLKNIIDKN